MARPIVDVAPVEPIDIVGPGQELLAGLITVFKALDITLPERVGEVPGGNVAFDGDQLTVNFAGITRGFPGAAQAQPTHPALLAQYLSYEVYLLRAVATINDENMESIPVPGILAADYAKLANDASTLWRAIVSLHASYALVSANVPFTYGPLLPVGPEGGLAGCKCTVMWSAT